MFVGKRAGKGTVLFAVLAVFSLWALGCESGVRHRDVREVSGTVTAVSAPTVVYDMHVFGIMWQTPKELVVGGPRDEMGGDRDDRGSLVVKEGSAHRWWFLFPSEKVPDNIIGMKITLRYRVLIAEDPPIVQVVDLKVNLAN
jgi:hypothetical protein